MLTLFAYHKNYAHMRSLQRTTRKIIVTEENISYLLLFTFRISKHIGQSKCSVSSTLALFLVWFFIDYKSLPFLLYIKEGKYQQSVWVCDWLDASAPSLSLSKFVFNFYIFLYFYFFDSLFTTLYCTLGILHSISCGFSNIFIPNFWLFLVCINFKQKEERRQTHLNKLCH